MQVDLIDRLSREVAALEPRILAEREAALKYSQTPSWFVLFRCARTVNCALRSVLKGSLRHLECSVHPSGCGSCSSGIHRLAVALPCGKNWEALRASMSAF